MTPYDPGKNLGKAYNEAISLIPDEDAVCLRDIDTLFLTPEQPAIIQQYYEDHPNSVLTCFTNRVSQLSRHQLLGGTVSENTDIREHIRLAEKQQEGQRTVTEIPRDISGFLMVVPKSVWYKVPFPEDGKCLGVDTYHNRMIRAAGIKILRMNLIYVFHTYRLSKGVLNKQHLV